MATRVCGCDQEIRGLDSAAMPFWVEIWVENRGGLESVGAGAAQSRSVQRDTSDRRLVVSGRIGALQLLGRVLIRRALIRVELIQADKTDVGASAGSQFAV